MLETAKNLKIISRYGVGYDKVDLEAAHAMGIKVSITPGANSDSVADLAMTLMLAAARNVCPMDAAIRAGGHDKPITGVEMWNKTLGVVGTGRIGKGVIQRASGFQMKVLANDAYPDPAFVEAHNGKYVDLDTLFRESDFITLHAPLTEETRNMVDARRLAEMKPRAVLVNTARGSYLFDQLKLDRQAFPIERAVAGNPRLAFPLAPPPDRAAFFAAYAVEPFDQVRKRYCSVPPLPIRLAGRVLSPEVKAKIRQKLQ